ncbi:MAG: 3-hydroxypropionyl-coenzyme A dehydratase [Promethearchaeota archaeon]|nr:MAG: 3-hydroxypropionyl-coenzyme A dehydratase [Candidatus Lokiarchaeota archaeon]
MNDDIILIEENEEKTITTIKLNRLDKKNALNYDLFAGISNALDKVEQTDTRVVIITGGEDIFSAGIDLKMLTGQDLPEGVELPDLRQPRHFRYWMNTWLQNIFHKIEKIEKPVIAKIKGHCLGSGFELALACDFRFALESAQFCMPETKLGMNPDVTGTIRLTRIVGISDAKDIILTGRTFNGKEAYRLGVINGVAKDSDELEGIIRNYTYELIESAPLAIGLSKRLIDYCYGKDVTLGSELETLTSSQLLQTKDFMTGALSKLQKKKPKWRWK